RLVKALILAAGLGMRMRPLTEELPKCLLPIGGKPLVTHILELLGRHGLRDVYINLYWHSDAIRRALADGADFGVRINYLAEEERRRDRQRGAHHQVCREAGRLGAVLGVVERRGLRL